MHIKPCHADKAHVGGRWDGLLFLNSSQRRFPILTTTSMKKGKLRKQTAEDTIHLEGTCTISKSLQISDFYVTLRLEAIAPRVEPIATRMEAISLRLEAIANRLEDEDPSVDSWHATLGLWSGQATR